MRAKAALFSILDMQQVETIFPATRADERAAGQSGAYRAAFVWIRNLAHARRAFGEHFASEACVELGVRLAQVAPDSASYILAVADDCFVLWASPAQCREPDWIEQVLVTVGTRPVSVGGQEFVAMLHAGWTALEADTPRRLTQDESNEVLFRASEATSPYAELAEHSSLDRFLTDMAVAVKVARALTVNRLSCQWQGIFSPYANANVLYWRTAPRLQAAGVDHGLYSYAQIMRPLERLGLTRLLDRSMALQVFGRLLRDPSLRLACRISSRSVQKDHYWTELLDALSSHPTVASRFTLEITSGSALASLESARAFCTALRERGARVAMAGFGSGSANLEGLQACAPQTLVLAESFVQRARSDPDAKRALRDLIRICTNLAEHVVVAGVECEQDFTDALRAGAQWVCGQFDGRSTFTTGDIHVRRPDDHWISWLSPDRAPSPRTTRAGGFGRPQASSAEQRPAF